MRRSPLSVPNGIAQGHHRSRSRGHRSRGPVCSRRCRHPLFCPSLQVLRRARDYEIRKYDPYIVAETQMGFGGGPASGSGFNTLAGYIFGNNASNRKYAPAPLSCPPAPLSMRPLDPVSPSCLSPTRFAGLAFMASPPPSPSAFWPCR